MRRPRLRVVQVVTKLALGGAQRTVLELCRGLDPERFDLTVLCGVEEDSEGTLLDEFRELDTRLELIPSMVRSVRGAADLAALDAMRRALRRLEPELVHTHTSKAGALGRVAARLVSVPAKVHTVHGWMFGHAGGAHASSMIRAERMLARWCDRLVVVTPDDRSTGLAHRIGRSSQYVLIRSGIETPAFGFDASSRRAARAELGLSDKAELIGTVGRLAEQKDPLTLLVAFRSVRQQRPDAHLAFVGDGPLRPELEEAIVRWDLADSVHLVGAQREPARWYSAMDLFTLSSRWEGLPRVALEAIAAGLPVVGTRVGGMEDLAVHHEVSLCEPGDEFALGAELRRVLDAPKPARVAPAWLDEFSATKMVSDTERLYQDLCRVKAAV